MKVIHLVITNIGEHMKKLSFPDNYQENNHHSFICINIKLKKNNLMYYLFLFNSLKNYCPLLKFLLIFHNVFHKYKDLSILKQINFFILSVWFFPFISNCHRFTFFRSVCFFLQHAPLKRRKTVFLLYTLNVI